MIGIEMRPIGFNKSKLLAKMKADGLGGVLLTSPENVFYTTGFPTLPSAGNPILYTLRNHLPFFSLISADDSITLFCWGFAAEGMTFGADEVLGFALKEQATELLVKKINDKVGSRPLGIESTCPFYVTTLLKESGVGGTLVVVDRILEDLRLIKSPEEILRIRKSTEIIEQTMTELMNQVIHPGMTRLELIQEGKARLFKNGGMGISHATFAFGTYNPEIAIGEQLEDGRLITLDLGGIYEGYASDTRRYVYTGHIDQDILTLHRRMVAIVDKVGARLNSGRRFSDVFQDAVTLYQENGLRPTFTSAGHCIGLETEEVWVTAAEQRVLEPGMVVNIELYTGAPTGEHVGDEETFVIDEQGPHRISSLPREIRRI